MKRNRKLYRYFNSFILIFFLDLIFFSNRVFSQDSYWESIQIAEDLFIQEEYDNSLTVYCTTFEKYGVCQLAPWMNAYKISETKLNGKYADSLLNFVIEEDNLYYLKKVRSKNKFLDGMVAIPMLDTLKRSSSKESIKLKKIARSKWQKLDRKDQRPRKFPGYMFVDNEKLSKLDSINRQVFFKLCEEFGDMVPSNMDLFFTGSFHPCDVIFQHNHLHTDVSDWNKMDSIFYNSIKYGKYTPNRAKNNLIYSVMRDVRKGIVKEYESSMDLAQDWSRITKYGSKEEAELAISTPRFQLINNLRQRIYLEPITDNYLKKRLVFKELGLSIQ